MIVFAGGFGSFAMVAFHSWAGTCRRIEVGA